MLKKYNITLQVNRCHMYYVLCTATVIVRAAQSFFRLVTNDISTQIGCEISCVLPNVKWQIIPYNFIRFLFIVSNVLLYSNNMLGLN